MTTASQQTLKTSIGCRGVGLHSGRKVRMTLRPAPPDTGIVFRRTDAGAEIQASWVNTIASPLCTVLSNGEGTTIGTVEHLMAALAGAEIDNAVVELDGPEIPIMDGSAAPFLFLIECAGLVEQDAVRRAIKVLKPLGDLYLAGGPIIGQFRGVRSGHGHTRQLLAALFADAEAWCHTTLGRTTGVTTLEPRDAIHLSGA